MNNHQYQLALNDAQEAARIDSHSSKAHYECASALLELKRYDEALAAYDAALQIEPNMPNVHNNRAIALPQMSRYEEAIAAWDAALLIDPNMSNAHKNRAFALHKMSRYDEAIAACDAALLIDPKMSDAHLYRALALANLRRYEEAVAAFDAAILIDSKFSGAYLQRARCQILLKNYSLACRDLAKILQLDPQHKHSGSIQKQYKSLLIFLNRQQQDADIEQNEALVENEDRVIDCGARYRHDDPMISDLYLLADAIKTEKPEHDHRKRPRSPTNEESPRSSHLSQLFLRPPIFDNTKEARTDNSDYQADI